MSAGARCFVCSNPLDPERRIGITGRVDAPRPSTDGPRPQRGDATLRMHLPCASYLAAQIMIALHAGWAAGEEMSEPRLPSLRANPADEIGLTPGELRVLQGLAAGLSNAQIAREAGLAAKTVKNMVSRILLKMGASSRTEAAVLALQRGLAGGPVRGV